MPKIGNYIEEKDKLCERCQSKRIVSKTWTETITSDYGSMILEHKQIICTNTDCQRVFDETIEADILRKAKLQKLKESGTQTKKTKVNRDQN